MENQALKTLSSIKVWNIEVSDYQVRIALSNATNILITMEAECSEDLYFKTDDDLRPSGKGRLIDIELSEGSRSYKDEDEDEDDFNESNRNILDSAFLRIITDEETFTICAYNAHNGYYEGFKIHCAIEHLTLEAWRQINDPTPETADPDQLTPSETSLLTEACLMAKEITRNTSTPTILEIKTSKEDGLISKILVHPSESVLDLNNIQRHQRLMKYYDER